MGAASLSCPFQLRCSSERTSFSHNLDNHIRAPFSPPINFKPFWKDLQHNSIFVNVPKTIKESSLRLLDAFVDLTFEFIDQPLLPCQSNFAPVEEIGEGVPITRIEGKIPKDFPEGVYIRNGPNPLFGGLKSTSSIFGKSSHTWIEGEGMLHALYFRKDGAGKYTISYNNRYIQTETYKLETKKNKPLFLPAIEGDSLAVLSAYLLNWLRFGSANKYISNTNVFKHSESFYSVAENHMPQEIDILTLETIGNWDVDGAWDRPFSSHPKKAPGTGELVIMGIYPQKPYFQLGVISADGRKLIHKADLKLDRCCLCHEIGVTRRYNVIMDFPLTLDINRLVKGGPLIKYNNEGYARIGIMPRYGNGDSVKWFEVKPSCTFHIINCFEDCDEVVVLACRARASVIPGPDFGFKKFEWFSRGFKHIDQGSAGNPHDGSFFSRAYEWRLNLNTGEVRETNLTGTKFSVEFPMISENFVGVRNRYGYAQVVDSNASSLAGMAKYGGLVKFYFEDRKPELQGDDQLEGLIKVEYHNFPKNTFCSGVAFEAKSRGVEEDDGWIIAYVHDENTNTSQVYIVDAKKFSSEPVAKIRLPSRVPYGFHGAFMSRSL